MSCMIHMLVLSYDLTVPSASNSVLNFSKQIHIHIRQQSPTDGVTLGRLTNLYCEWFTCMKPPLQNIASHSKYLMVW